MDPKTLDAARGFADAITRLALVLGTWPTVVVLIAFAAMWLIASFVRDARRERLYKDMVTEKEKEIERLAESNREFRTIILRFKSYPEHLLQADAKDSSDAKEKRGAK